MWGLFLSQGKAHGSLCIEPFPVTDRAYLPTAFPLMAEIEQKTVVTQLMAKLRHGQHFNPAALKAVTINDGPKRLAILRDIRGNVPSLQEDSIAGGELNVLKRHSEGGGGVAVIRIRIAVAGRGNDVRQEPRNDAIQKNDQQKNQDSGYPLDGAPESIFLRRQSRFHLGNKKSSGLPKAQAGGPVSISGP